MTRSLCSVLLFCACVVLGDGLSVAKEVSPTMCPPGVSVVNCFADPCSVSQCDVPGATCRPNYCGGCNAEWFGPDGNPISVC